jgi:hypothetical protein
MKTITGTFKALLGLFFDDGSLAAGILILLVALASIGRAGLLASPGVAIVLLVGGTLLLLLDNVLRAARMAKRSL